MIMVGINFNGQIYAICANGANSLPLTLHAYVRGTYFSKRESPILARSYHFSNNKRCIVPISLDKSACRLLETSYACKTPNSAHFYVPIGAMAVTRNQGRRVLKLKL